MSYHICPSCKKEFHLNETKILALPLYSLCSTCWKDSLSEYRTVALIYCGFDCDKCGAYECADPADYNKTAKVAEEKGWSVSPAKTETLEWQILCPTCKGSDEN